jgi:hypothetical protein
MVILCMVTFALCSVSAHCNTVLFVHLNLCSASNNLEFTSGRQLTNATDIHPAYNVWDDIYMCMYIQYMYVYKRTNEPEA